MCTVFIVLPMRTTRRRKWKKESEYPEPRSAIGFYSKNPCVSSMVPPFERVIWNFNRLKWKRMKKDEFWTLWDVIWIRYERVMAERKIGNEGFTREMKVLVFFLKNNRKYLYGWQKRRGRIIIYCIYTCASLQPCVIYT